MRFLRNLFQQRLPKKLDISSLPNEGLAPELRGITGWIGSRPLTLAELRGKAVLVDFWTYSCVNCVRTVPALQALHEKYAAAGLVIIGVHTPEFPFEREPKNVEDAVARFGITYPVALDTDYATWNAYRNEYWPAHYFVDASGVIRHHHFGEGGYDDAESVIRALLAEAGSPVVSSGATMPAEIDYANIGTPETYFGYDRLEYLGSPESVLNERVQRYGSVPNPAKGVFYLEGPWIIRADHAEPTESGAAVTYRFSASKVHLVADVHDAEARLRVTLDGKPLDASNAGADVKSADGTMTVREGRMYDLVSLPAKGTHLLRVEFLDPGVRCFAFTFG